MGFMPPTDSMFLLVESREHPMHVGGLLLLEPPGDAGPEFVQDLVAGFRDTSHLSNLFRKRPADPVGSLGATWWTVDETVDADYHVRHTALPQPGRIRELLQNVSHWHGTLLDRHRPLWEAYVVEGLADGRIGLYTKIHHSLVDGVSALGLLRRAFDEDPDRTDCVPPWALAPRAKASATAPGGPRALATSGLRAAGEVASLVPGALKVAQHVWRESDVTLPRAPRTILNGPVGGARRFAAQSWEIERLVRVAKASGTTLNDVVMAMVGGALRAYLLEQHALPDEPLTAMVPVSLDLRNPGRERDGGNAIGMIIVNLATDEPLGGRRLERISQSAGQAKRLLGELSQTQILAVSGLQMLPLGLAPLPGVLKYTRPPFNVIISNVPGPRAPMYFNGARLDGMYPASIVLDGQAVNVTLCSRDDQLDVGIVGCRRSVPSLQRLLTHLEDALAELELAWPTSARP